MPGGGTGRLIVDDSAGWIRVWGGKRRSRGRWNRRCEVHIEGGGGGDGLDDDDDDDDDDVYY